MQPMNPTRPPTRPPARRPPPLPTTTITDSAAAGVAGLDSDSGAPLEPSALRVSAVALLVEARFRDVTLASRLLHAGAPGAFTIGAARGVDAPVNPAWLAGSAAADLVDLAGAEIEARHVLVEPVEGGFAINLAAAMRAELCTPVQRLPLAPDQGDAEAPLALPPHSSLRIPCGEVVFEIQPADPAPAVPRPWISSRWRAEARYPLAVTLALLALVAVVSFVPDDPRALSFDPLGASPRFDYAVSIPPVMPTPEVDHAPAAQPAAGGGATGAAAAKAAGQAGDRRAREADRRLTIKGPVAPRDAREAAARVRTTGILPLLDGPSASAVFGAGPALGDAAEDVLGHLVATVAGPAYGEGALDTVGTGEGGGGTHEGAIGVGQLGTLGRFGSGRSGPGFGPGDGPGHGPGSRYGVAAGSLGPHHAVVPDFRPGIPVVKGSLDKEIIRRIVRRHLNEVRFCYEQALASHPGLAGRVVVQFSIAPTGRVLASFLQSSSLGVVAVDACVVNAVKRWEFPQPSGGGLVMVSYPFQLAPAGG